LINVSSDRTYLTVQAAHSLCQALAAKLVITEGLTGHEAVLLGAQAREGKTEAPFIRTWREVAAPPSKKPRSAMVTSQELTSATADNAGTLPHKSFGQIHMIASTLVVSVISVLKLSTKRFNSLF
jgi:hypothetical protein